MTGKSKKKTGLRAAISSAALVTALVLPGQALAQAPQGECANAGTDPTAAQYCSGSGVQTGGGNDKAPTSQSGGSQGEQASSSPAPVAESSGTAAADTSGSGSLPFTGLDVGILLLVAAILVGTGLALRRLTASGVKQG